MQNLNGFNPNGFGSRQFDFSGMNLGGNQVQSTSQAPAANQHDFGIPDMQTELNKGITVAIRKLYFGETRPQNEQWRRNYNSFIDGNTSNAIQQAVSQDASVMTDPLKLSTFLSEAAPIVNYTTTAERPVDITNGWETPRYRFTMVVDIYRNGNYAKTEFVSGYTDEQAIHNASLENSFSISPNMVFNINQVTDAAARTTDAWGQTVPLISASSQVLANHTFTGLGSGNQMLSMRPKDIVGVVGRLGFYDDQQAALNMGVVQEQQVASFMDLSNVIGGMPQLSSADNALIPTFTSRMVNALLTSRVNDFAAPTMDGQDPNHVAKLRVQEMAFTTCNFIYVMNRMLANDVVTTASFTMADLMRMDPTIDDRAVIFGRSFEDGSAGLIIPDGRNVDSIGKVTHCAMAATCVSNTIIQLMSKAGVSMLAMHIDNLAGVDDAKIQAAAGMDYDGELAKRLEMIKTRLIAEAIPMIKPDLMSLYEIDIMADAFNDVFIEIRIDNDKDQFLIPAYASSSFSPLVTNDFSNVIGVARSINSVVNTCAEVAGQKKGLVDINGNAFNSMTAGHEDGFGSNY